ncbi:hypothetical protein [Parashewanella tropica]|uniref:hypothetical protein n=1 Tax=Parashewanella tropica TaxID=2547970 RepID=UPI0010597364|nr:hypothetical protein [Parashewanella tropica]
MAFQPSLSDQAAKGQLYSSCFIKEINSVSSSPEGSVHCSYSAKLSFFDGYIYNIQIVNGQLESIKLNAEASEALNNPKPHLTMNEDTLSRARTLNWTGLYHEFCQNGGKAKTKEGQLISRGTHQTFTFGEATNKGVPYQYSLGGEFDTRSPTVADTVTQSSFPSRQPSSPKKRASLQQEPQYDSVPDDLKEAITSSANHPRRSTTEKPKPAKKPSTIPASKLRPSQSAPKKAQAGNGTKTVIESTESPRRKPTRKAPPVPKALDMTPMSQSEATIAGNVLSKVKLLEQVQHQPQPPSIHISGRQYRDSTSDSAYGSSSLPSTPVDLAHPHVDTSTGELMYNTLPSGVKPATDGLKLAPVVNPSDLLSVDSGLREHSLRAWQEHLEQREQAVKVIEEESKKAIAWVRSFDERESKLKLQQEALLKEKAQIQILDEFRAKDQRSLFEAQALFHKEKKAFEEAKANSSGTEIDQLKKEVERYKVIIEEKDVQILKLTEQVNRDAASANVKSAKQQVDEERMAAISVREQEIQERETKLQHELSDMTNKHQKMKLIQEKSKQLEASLQARERDLERKLAELSQQQADLEHARNGFEVMKKKIVAQYQAALTQCQNKDQFLEQKQQELIQREMAIRAREAQIVL